MIKLFSCIALLAIAFVPAMGHSAEALQPVDPKVQAARQIPIDFLTKINAEVKTRLDKYREEIKRQTDLKNKNTTDELKKRFERPRPKYTKPDLNAPFISEIIPSGGVGPREFFYVLGSNLVTGSGSTEVHVQFAGKNPPIYLQAGATESRLTCIMGSFDGIPGATPALVTVKYGNNQSAPFNYTVVPEKVVQELALSTVQDHLIADSKGTNPVYDATRKGKNIFFLADNWTLGSVHDSWVQNRSNITAQVNGTDEYFLTSKLLNNWKLKDFVWFNPVNKPPGASPGQTSAAIRTIIDSSHSTDSPYIKIDWWNMYANMYQSIYYVRFIIEGPKGVPYH
jgi:hypothetical protein